MAEFALSDPLLVELRRARPDGPDRSADDPGAVSVLERIVSIDPKTPHNQTDLQGRQMLRQPQSGSNPLRRVAISSVAAGMVAAAILAGLGVIGSGDHRPTNTRTAFAIQAVAQRTKAALTAAVTQYVEQSVTKTTYPQTEAVPARVTNEWTNATRTNIDVVNPSGAPFEDVWYSGSAAAPSGTTEVLYPIRAWWTKTVPVVVTQMQDITGLDIAARIQDWVNAGTLSVVGTPTIAGQKTIEVSGNALTLGQAAHTLPASTGSTHQFDLTIWLDPSTYLPVQFTTTYATPTDPGRTTSTTSTVSWLPTTSANLAKLQGQVPSGFTHLAGPPSIATGSLPTTAK